MSELASVWWVPTYLTLEDFGSQPFKTNPDDVKSRRQTPYSPEYPPYLPPINGSDGSDSVRIDWRLVADATYMEYMNHPPPSSLR